MTSSGSTMLIVRAADLLNALLEFDHEFGQRNHGRDLHNANSFAIGQLFFCGF